jgi:hypothetical protein
MSTELITENVWETLTAAARAARQPCDVAVAYFAKNASLLLPLPEGSRLVVDASEAAVTSGQTCPAELVKLLKRGVTIHSVPNLHAKVFVLGKAAYVGSANVSGSSASRLVEAVVRSTDVGFIRGVTKFVRSLCLHPLTPQVLEKLSGLYVPPRIPGGGRPKGVSGSVAGAPELPTLRIARLRADSWSAWDEANIDETMGEAERRRERGSGYSLDYFKWTGRCAFEEGDVVIMITTEADGRELVSPPGSVVDKVVRKRKKGGTEVTYVYVERPDLRRRSLETMVSKVGVEAGAKLARSGQIRNAEFARKLMGAWTR